MNRIDKKFQELKAKKKPAFIPFITARDPDLQTTKDLILEFEKKNADVIELGIPFTDPIADGPIIQASYYRALVRGVKVAHILDMVSEVRRKSEIPMVAMVSYSTVFKKGYPVFIENAIRAGLDGLTVPDMPVEEKTHADDWQAFARSGDGLGDHRAFGRIHCLGLEQSRHAKACKLLQKYAALNFRFLVHFTLAAPWSLTQKAKNSTILQPSACSNKPHQRRYHK